MSGVVVVDYGAGNTRSVRAALAHLGASSVVSSDPKKIAESDMVILPGVGSARTAMDHLESTGAALALRDRFAAGSPILGICLGMQLALEHSDEDGGVDGIGLLPGSVHLMTEGRVPRLGWANVEPWGEASTLPTRSPRRAPTAWRRPRASRSRSSVDPSWASSSIPKKVGPPVGLPRAMPLARLIPCLDVAHGRVVKGVNFVGLRDVGDPVELARFYSDGGADELVFLDITATPEDSATMTSVVADVADVLEIPFTVGGGVRSVEDAIRIIESGADRVSLNSAALADPGLISAIARRYGSQAVVVAIDAGDGVVHTHGGRVATSTETIPWAVEAASRGAGEILLTSIAHDGRREGFDLALTGAVRDAVTIPVIASGGAGSAQHVADALRIADAALIASIVHENPAGLPGLRREIQELGIQLRPIKELI